MLDAPVSGGVEGARVRDLLVMVGGDEPTFQRCLPVLEAIGERVMHTGDIGSGCICKIMHNTAVFCADLAMTECWTLAIKSGVPAETIVDVFRNGAIGRMSNLWGRLPDTFFQGDFEARFALKTAHKDLRLGRRAGRSLRSPNAPGPSLPRPLRPGHGPRLGGKRQLDSADLAGGKRRCPGAAGREPNLAQLRHCLHFHQKVRVCQAGHHYRGAGRAAFLRQQRHPHLADFAQVLGTQRRRSWSSRCLAACLPAAFTAISRLAHTWRIWAAASPRMHRLAVQIHAAPGRICTQCSLP